MLHSALLAIGSALLTYGVDYTMFAKVTNVQDISRLSDGAELTNRKYQPFTSFRVVLTLFAATMTFIGCFFEPPIKQILLVFGGISAAMMALITYGHCVSDRSS